MLKYTRKDWGEEDSEFNMCNRVNYDLRDTTTKKEKRQT